MKRNERSNIWMSVMLCALLLLSAIGMTGSVGGEGETDLDIDDFVFLETGTRDKKPDDNWDQGDFVAINMTKNGALSWFGVVYGTEEDPNGILILCAYIRFLGAAEVYEANGNFLGRYPIPIITIFGQRLHVLFEYTDDGRFYSPIPGTWEDHPEYADNGVFDFVQREDDPGIWAVSDQHESVTKAINLNRAWTRSAVTETADPEDPATKTWDFSLSAENVEYGIENEKGEMVLTDPENVLEKIEFTFHVSANVDEVNITGVPWYEVTVDSGNHKEVIDSEIVETKDYVGHSVTADFKFDHLIEGWDYSGGDGLVLINHGFFANGIPEKVEEWLGAPFLYKVKGGGKAVYEAFDPSQDDALNAVVNDGTQEEDANGDGIVDPKIVSKDIITFKDNWQDIGELTWVSDAEVDGEDKNVTYQVHGGQSFNDTFEKKDGKIIGFIIQGGYIYPAGSTIYHDPSLIATALIFNVVDYAINLLPGNLVGGQFVVSFLAAVIVGTIVSVRRRKGKSIYRTLPHEAINGEQPAEAKTPREPPYS
jgi:hypothetical protein